MAGWWSAVGWNCMNSTSATGTPARRAMARPSPVASAGLVVTAKSWPAPPVASTVWRGPDLDHPAVGARGRRTPRHRPPSTSRSRANHSSSTAAAAGPGGVDQGPLHLGPGGRPSGVDHPGRGVAALTGQGQGPAGLPVEDGAHGDQLVDPGRAFVDQDPDRVGVAQAGPGGQGVGQVEIGRVLVAAEHGGHAALGPPGGRLGELGLGQHADPEPGRAGGSPPPGGGRVRPAGPRPTGPATPLPEDQDVQRAGVRRRSASRAGQALRSATAQWQARGVEVVDQPDRADLRRRSAAGGGGWWHRLGRRLEVVGVDQGRVVQRHPGLGRHHLGHRRLDGGRAVLARRPSRRRRPSAPGTGPGPPCARSADSRAFRLERARPSRSRTVGHPTTSVGQGEVGDHPPDQRQLLEVLLAEVGPAAAGGRQAA